MIRYVLKCANAHQFEVWFRSSEDCDRQLQAGQALCPDCGNADVAKSIMAPSVPSRRERAAHEVERLDTPPPSAQALSGAPDPSTVRHALEMKLRALRRHVEASAENVGQEFATVAREMHNGDREAQPIYGEANPQEARELVEDGVQIAPLPWIDKLDD